jgi:acetyltransferase-like isoleucine patch superfamily enzyme
MKALFKNPLTLWLKWYLQSRKILNRNRGKNLVIGYMSNVSNAIFGRYNTIYNNVVLGNVVLGNYIYISDGTKITNASIGNFCSIGPNVKIGGGMHPTNLISTFPSFYSVQKQCQVTFVKKNQFEEKGNVEIENDVWIGQNVIIMDNVKICNGSIIGAGAVVTKDVEPYSIVGGVPAKLIRKRFLDKEINQLLSTKWWEKDDLWLKENHELFYMPKEFFRQMQ